YRHQRLDRSKHVLLVSAIVADTWNFQVPAVAKISAPARGTRAVLAAVPSHANALSHLPSGNTLTHFIDPTGDFVPRYPRVLNAGPLALLRKHVTVADPAGLHFDTYLSHAGLGNLAVDDLEIRSRFRNLRRFHWCDCDSCSCHGFS